VAQSLRSIVLRAVGAAALLAFTAVSAQTDTLTPSYTKPGVNLKQYKQFVIKPLNLEDTRLIPPPWVEKPDPKVWHLSKDNQDFLRKTFASAVKEGVESEGKFKVVTEPAPGTLQVDVHLLSLTPWASRDEKAETLGSGTLTFEAHVRDAATAELLAVYQGTQQVGKAYQENTPANKMTDIKAHFTDWGRNISKRLAAAQAQ
jgi:Protein of unknown function (DUF3313)